MPNRPQELNQTMSRKQPRPIEFLTKGYSVAQMQTILSRWDTLTDAELVELGFSDYAAERAAPVRVPAARLH
jgi:hypothetical protein